MSCDTPTEDEIQAFIDGRLEGSRRAQVAAYLLRHPERSSDVRTLRKLTQDLKELDREVLSEPVPERLLDVIRRTRNNG